MAGIGIKTERYLRKVPDNVINRANELNVPIMHIPNHYAFIEVINPVLAKIINDQADRLKKSETIHKSFTQLVIDGGDIQDILKNLKVWSFLTFKIISFMKYLMRKGYTATLF